jgi:hypothetical protein
METAGISGPTERSNVSGARAEARGVAGFALGTARGRRRPVLVDDEAAEFPGSLAAGAALRAGVSGVGFASEAADH